MTRSNIGNYRIVREVGAGGMGAVYEAVDQMLERTVAIKMLRAEIAGKPELIERFRSEAVTLARLNHPAVATLYNFFREGEEYYMVMEFVRGQTLEAVLRRSGRLTPELAAAIMRQTLEGMAHAHALGVLHRDIKPANIMVTGEGTVKVTDFGIARILGSSRMTREGRIVGTLEYIAPERIRGEEADIRSDLYSAGVVLFETLAGRLPFVSDTDYALMQAHVTQAPPQLAELGVACPPELEAILRRALAKAPAERFQSAEEFHEALAVVAGQAAPLKPTRLAEAAIVPILAAQPSGSQRGPGDPEGRATGKAPVKRLSVAVLVAAVAVLVVALSAGLFAWIRHNHPPTPPPPQVAAVPASPAPAAAAPALVPIPEPATLPPSVQASDLRSALSSAPPEPARRARAIAPKEPEPRLPPPVVNETEAPVAAPHVPESRPTLTEVLAEPVKSPPPKPSGPKSIHQVRKLHVAAMEGGLDGYIKEEIRKQLPHRLAVVSRPEDADALMVGTGEKRGGTGSKITSGYLGMKAAFTGSVAITDLDGAKVLWESEAGDNTAVIGVLKRGGPKKVAERLVGSLRKVLEGK